MDERIRVKKLFKTIVFVGLIGICTIAPFAQGKELNFQVLVPEMAAGGPYWKNNLQGMEKAGAKNGFKVFAVDAHGDIGNQMAQLENAIAKKVDAILIAPVETKALASGIKKANEAGVPIVVFAREIDQEALKVEGARVECFVGYDFKEIGVTQTQWILEWLSKNPRYAKPYRLVLLTGTPGSGSAVPQNKGFHEVLDPLEAKGEVKIVAERSGNWVTDKALAAMENILATTRDIHAVIGGNDSMAMGAIGALKAVKLLNNPTVVIGNNAFPFALEAVNAGELLGTVIISTEQMGYWASEMAYKVVTTKKKPPQRFMLPLSMYVKGTTWKPEGAIPSLPWP